MKNNNSDNINIKELINETKDGILTIYIYIYIYIIDMELKNQTENIKDYQRDYYLKN
jgi:hypothetical protein